MLLSPTVLRRLCRARDRLREETDTAVSLAAVAREAGLSSTQFLVLFTAAFGQTPHQARIDARLDRARHLLALGDRSVTDVCFDVGYSSLGSFSALFRRQFGETPSAYRRQRRALVAVPGALVRPLPGGCFGLLAGLPADVFRGFREASRPAPDAHSRST